MIGEWLRQQPVALKLGSVLFVHGGISPRVARTGLDVGQLNAAMQDYWNDTDPHPPSPGLDAVLGHAGVTQYRGWFRALEGRYPEASRSEEHTSELQSLMRISYAVLCLKKKKNYNKTIT